MSHENFTIALAGNPNCGKTTLFNSLTGSRQYVGNWPGVTVEKKEGYFVSNGEKIKIVDLPGIYSLSPYSMEEIVSKNYIIEENPDVVVNIVDAANLERNLFLTLQLLSLRKPMIIALNMIDVAQKMGHEINIRELEKKLGLRVIPIVASRNEGVEELVDAIRSEAGITRETPVLEEFFDRISEIEDTVASEDMREEKKTDLTYEFIESISTDILKKPEDEKYTVSDRIDQVVTNKYLAIPIFALMMFFTFFVTFDLVGNPMNEFIDGLIAGTIAPFLESVLLAIGAQSWLIALIIDGILSGVGGVLVFIPNVACLFLMISLMEDTGYMARVAFIMDRAMRNIGLSGKAFIPLVLGIGCNVPAIMSTRTLENEKDRLTSILINPFVSCSARLPVYTLFAAAFFPGREKYIVFSLYALGILVAITVGLVFKKTLFKADETPFIMELPQYRFPSPKNLFLHIWDRVKGFIIKAGTLIFGASVVLWFMLNYNFSGPSEINSSIGASIGKMIAPLFAPLGFGSYQASLSLLTGVLAKEVVIANMAIIYGIGETAGEFAAALSSTFTPISAYAFMIFVLLYTPCVSVIGVIRRETNSIKWTVFSVLYQFGIAWFVSMAFYQIASLLLG